MKLKSGDIFWEKYNGRYFFARVLMDMDIPFKSETLKPQGLFRSMIYSAAYYVEMYKGVYDTPELQSEEVLFTDFFMRLIFRKSIYKGEGWGKHGHKPVDPVMIDFPEYVTVKKDITDKTKLHFLKGEIYTEKTIPDDKFQGLTGDSGLATAFTTLIRMSLSMQNRDDLLLPGDRYPVEKIYRSDMRYNPDMRKQIYATIGEDPGMSYFNLALKHNCDIRRFF